ncbi:MAG: TonB-dependent receptor plug domain-containing protein, partial [Prevotellaceae bacterium]|nr:TonB-dependent receptor plug domain-containing protein [Prevotellaceae bacterium]
MKREFFLLCAFCAFALAVQAQQDSLRQVDLDGIMVTAARAGEQTPMAYSNLNKQEIKSRSIEGDVPMLLDMIPSVIVSTESGTGTGNSSLRIRGADASRVNVTLDGVPLNDAESQSVFWVNMPDLLSSVGSVQVQRGVGTSTNGTGTFGGAISLQTARPASKPYGEVGVAAGMFNTYKYNVVTGTGLMDNGFSFDARYSRVLSDGFVDRTGSDDYSLYGSATWFGKNNSVRLSVIHGNQQTGLHGGVPKDSIDAGNRTYNPAGEYVDNDGNIAYYGNENDNYKQTHYHLTYSHQLGNSWKASATLYYTRGEGYYEQYKANRKLEEYGLTNLNFNG